ncbi:copper amine oxidase N-terminal domain-containing protein [Agathobaculum sp. Marseille-P7918]|uniref:copper amine oxidase N-terminal domain-containing protein n=1 Tax=Agathobaculum sp. Marseille-P7918 TaxID=2479843 RepID=UPI0035662B55
MKKKSLRVPVLCLICGLLLSSVAFAVSNRTITVSYGDITIYLNGEKKVATDVSGKVVEPLIYEGTTYVPVRAISEWFGKTVTWQGSTNSVLINDSAFSDTEVSTAEGVIKNFFDLFGAGQYQEMKALCTGDAAGFDYSSGVFGMKEAKLLSCTYNGNYSARADKLVFECAFEMKPAENSVYDPAQTKTSCLIYVEKAGDRFRISEFASGF